MGQTLQAWEERTKAILGGVADTLLPPGDRVASVKQALRRHSRLFPRVTFSDFPGNGSSFELAISPGMPSWVNGFSVIDGIEYPQGERVPVFLDSQSYELYPSDSAPTLIRLKVDTPSTGETARVYYTALWPVPTTNPAIDLVPDSDFDAVCHLAAYVAAGQLESRAAGNTRPTLVSAQLAGVEGESERWRKRKEELLREYFAHFGIDPDSVVPADGIIDWDAMSSFADYGHQFLFRRGRR